MQLRKPSNRTNRSIPPSLTPCRSLPLREWNPSPSMSIALISSSLALLFCIGALPLVKRLALRFGLYDAQGPLKIHCGSIPRLGGIAMFAGFIAGISILYMRTARPGYVPLLVFAGVWAVGLIDDIGGLGPSIRFCVQIAAGSTLWLAGWRLEWFRSQSLDFAATCLFVAFFVNAMNLLDGMDGLATVTAAMVGVGFLLISAGGSNSFEIVAACSLLGACVGMLTVNAPPAKMFMGDSGSTLLGIVLAFLSLNWVRNQSNSDRILIPIIFLCVPLADAMLAIFRRALSRHSLFAGDRRHYYDILLQRGWPVNRVLRTSMSITGILVFIGWLCAQGIVGLWLAVFVVLGALAAAAQLLGSLRSESLTVPPVPHDSPLSTVID